MEVWVQIISTVGFPIAAFLIAAYGLKYAYDKSIEQNSGSDSGSEQQHAGVVTFSRQAGGS